MHPRARASAHRRAWMTMQTSISFLAAARLERLERTSNLTEEQQITSRPNPFTILHQQRRGTSGAGHATERRTPSTDQRQASNSINPSTHQSTTGICITSHTVSVPERRDTAQLTQQKAVTMCRCWRRCEHCPGQPQLAERVSKRHLVPPKNSGGESPWCRNQPGACRESGGLY